MAFKAVAGAGEEKVALGTLLTSSNPDEIAIGTKQYNELAKRDPQTVRKWLKRTLEVLNENPAYKGKINLNNLKGFPKEVLDGIVSNTKSSTSTSVTNAPTPKTVDDALKAPSTTKTTASTSSKVPSSSAPYYYVRGKDGTSKIYEGENIYKAVPREAFGTVEPTGTKGIKKGTTAPKPSTATPTTTGVKKGTSSPAPKSVDSVIKPTSTPKPTPKPTPKVVTPSTITTPVASTPVASIAPIPSVSTTPPIATPYNSLSPSVYDTVTPAPAPTTRPIDSVIKPTPAPASTPVAPAPTPASTSAAPAPTPTSAPAPKTITTPKLFSVPASASAPSPSLGPLPSASSTPVATPAGSPLSSSVYGTVTPTPASAPAPAPTAASTTTTTSAPSSSAPAASKPAASGTASTPKPAATSTATPVNNSGPIRPSTFVDASGKALKYGSRALLGAAIADDAMKGNDAGVLADLIMALGGRPGGIIGGILHPTELGNSDLYINGVDIRKDKASLTPSALASAGLNGQSAGIGAVAASREKENNQEMEDLFDTFSSLGAEPYGEVPFIMASNGVPYFQNEEGFTHQPYNGSQSLSYTYYGGQQNPVNDPGEITDANRSISMPTKKATITTASTPATTSTTTTTTAPTAPAPAPVPARRRRQATSPMETAITAPSPREQLAAQRAAALNNARLQQQQAAAQYAALNAPKPGFNPSGYATGHEAYYDPYKSQLLFR